VVKKKAGELVADTVATEFAAAEKRLGKEAHKDVHVPSHKLDDTKHRGMLLKDFYDLEEIRRAQLIIPEVAAIRCYTGPMYVPYNAVLRGVNSKVEYLQKALVKLCCEAETETEFEATTITFETAKAKANLYTTTLHAINSGVIKLSKLTVAEPVYRGLAGGVLPFEQFWKKNDFGVMGGVDPSFMSTSLHREVALGYIKQEGKKQQILLEIQMGMIDRGADISMLSQYPGEGEVLFGPLTGLEVQAPPRVEDGILIISMRLSCNLQDRTLDQVIGKMKTSHIDLISMMINDLRHVTDGLPPSVLAPLDELKQTSEQRPFEYYNNASQYLEATNKVLAATDRCYSNLAKEVTWKGLANDVVTAKRMRLAAEKCKGSGRSKEAAALNKMAAKREPSANPEWDDMKLRAGSHQVLASGLSDHMGGY